MSVIVDGSKKFRSEHSPDLEITGVKISNSGNRLINVIWRSEIYLGAWDVPELIAKKADEIFDFLEN